MGSINLVFLLGPLMGVTLKFGKAIILGARGRGIKLWVFFPPPFFLTLY